MFIKKFLAILLALAMFLFYTPVSPVRAAGQGSLEPEAPVTVDMPLQNATTTIPGGPVLADGSHELWIDRIGNLPAYAADFYGWLEENTDTVLADPTLGTLRKDAYVHQVATVTASVDYTYGAGESAADAARTAASSHGSQMFSVVMDFAVETYSAFLRDHPQVFWLSGGSSYTWSMTYNYDYANGSGTASYTMQVYFYLQNSSFDIRDAQFRDASDISAGVLRREQDVQRILGDCPVGSTYEQLRYLNRVLTETNVYYSAANSGVSLLPWQCLSALGGTDSVYGPVCEGYAKAFKVLCDELEIPCVLVEGDARSSRYQTAGAHMWNYVMVDGGWYAVDVTWNDPVVTAGDPALSGYECEDWFLLGSESLVDTDFTFLQSHPVTNVVSNNGLNFSNGPVLETQAYELPEDYMDVSAYRTGEYTAPAKEGMVFAGWFADAAMTEPLAKETTTGYAYAKFMDSETLTLKFQVTAGTSAESKFTNLRLLTAVADLDLQWVSFDLAVGENNRVLRSTHVYSEIVGNGVSLGSADRYFGPDAAYYATFTIAEVPQENFDSVFAVTPGWMTQDGTWVCGTQRAFSIGQIL